MQPFSKVTCAGFAALLAATALTATAQASTAPTAPNVTARPATATKSRTASVTFKASTAKGAKAVCSLDGAAEKRCTSPFRATALTDGTHRLTITGVSSDGKARSMSISVIWIVDNVAPVLVVAPNWRLDPIVGKVVYRLTCDSTDFQHLLAHGPTDIEQSLAVEKPSSSAAKVKANLLQWYPGDDPDVGVFWLDRTTPIRWIRLWDAAGNASGWYKAD